MQHIISITLSTESNEKLLFLMRRFARVNVDFIEQISILTVVFSLPPLKGKLRMYCVNSLTLEVIFFYFFNSTLFTFCVLQASSSTRRFSMEVIRICKVGKERTTPFFRKRLLSTFPKEGTGAILWSEHQLGLSCPCPCHRLCLHR